MNCVEALGSLFYIIHMRTFRESTQIFCSSLNGAQLALLHAPTLGCVGNGGEDGCGGGGSSGGDGCGGGRPSELDGCGCGGGAGTGRAPAGAREATAARASMAARGQAAGAMARAATIGMAAATTAVTTAAAAGDSVAGDSPVALRCVDACARGEEAGESGCSTSLWTHKLVSGSSRSYLDGSCRWSR